MCVAFAASACCTLAAYQLSSRMGSCAMQWAAALHTGASIDLCLPISMLLCALWGRAFHTVSLVTGQRL